jgi:hypothetical protein
MIAARSAIRNFGGRCGFSATRGTGPRRRAAESSAAVVLLCLLVQGCGNSETKDVTKAEPGTQRLAYAKADIVLPSSSRSAHVVQPVAADSFAERFAAISFAERFAAIGNTAATTPAPQMAAATSAPRAAGDRPGAVPSGSYKVASLSPVLPSFGLPATKQEQTRLIGFENSAFPYSGTNPRTGSATYSRGGRYSDNRVLVHVPAEFDVRQPGVIVVYFHGHGATLERDVRDRQQLPRQISESGLNAVLVAPQLAYDAADSSAGKFWERGGLRRFLTEAADHLARLYGDPRAAESFARMPVVIVAYSGGFVAAASSLHVGGVGNRVRGVVLLDAIYGEMDKFSSWIANNRSAFFISAYTEHNRRRDDELARLVKEKGIPVSYELNGPLKPGTVAFLATGEGVSHRSYVTLAWTEHPVKDVLLRIARR